MVSYHSDQTVAARHGGSSFTKPVYSASFSGESHFHLVYFNFCFSLLHRNLHMNVIKESMFML